jgi:hypothetical protein
MPTKYSETLANQYYELEELFPLCQYIRTKKTQKLLMFYETLANQLTDDEILAASNDAVSAARLVADTLAKELNNSEHKIVKYNTEPKPVEEIRKQITKANETGDVQGYFKAFSDMAGVQIIIPNPDREVYYHLGTLLHDLYGEHDEEGDLYKNDEDDPRDPQYIYTTTLEHIVKVELLS